MADRRLPTDFESKPEPKKERVDTVSTKRKSDWRDLVRLGDEAPSGTFRIPRI